MSGPPPGRPVIGENSPSGDEPNVGAAATADPPDVEGYGTGGFRSLFDRMSWAVVAEITNLGATALIFKILADLLELDEYGGLSAVLGIAIIIGPLSTFGANWVLIRRAVLAADIRNDVGRAVNTAGVGTTGAVVVATAVMVAIPGFLSDISRVTFALILVGQVICYWMLELGVTAAVAKADLRLAAILRTVGGVIRILSVVAFALGPTHSIDVWAWYFAIGQLLAAAAVHLMLARSLGGFPALSRTPLREYYAGFPYGLGNTTEGVLAASDKPLLTQYGFRGPDGAYAAGYRVVSLGFTPLLALMKAQDRRFFRHGAGGSGAAYHAGVRMSLLGLAVTVPVSAVLWLAAPLLTVVIDDSFVEAETVIRFLALLPIIKGFQFSFGNSLTAAGSQKTRMWLTGAAAVGNLIGNLIFIPSWGWQAAAVTTLVAEAALAAGFATAAAVYAGRNDG